MRFTGNLKSPIIISTRSPGLLNNTPEALDEIKRHNDAEYARAFTEQFQKIAELRQHLGLEKEIGNPIIDSTLLTLRLAQTFIPGFRVKNIALERGRGRKKDWDSSKYSELLADCELLRSEKDRSDSEICRVLSTAARFKQRWSAYKPSTLKNKLILARREDLNLVYKLRNGMLEKLGFAESEFTKMLIDIYSVNANQK